MMANARQVNLDCLGSPKQHIYRNRLTRSKLVVTFCTAQFNVKKFCVVYGFRTNSYYFHG